MTINQWITQRHLSRRIIKTHRSKILSVNRKKALILKRLMVINKTYCRSIILCRLSRGELILLNNRFNLKNNNQIFRVNSILSWNKILLPSRVVLRKSQAITNKILNKSRLLFLWIMIIIKIQLNHIIHQKGKNNKKK